MKIFFILLTFTHGIFAQNHLTTIQKIDDLKIKKSHQLFYIQVGAFKNMKYATIVFEELEGLNYSLHIEEKKVDMDYFFKLLIGPYRSKEEAYSSKKSLPPAYTDSFVLTYNN